MKKVKFPKYSELTAWPTSPSVNNALEPFSETRCLLCNHPKNHHFAFVGKNTRKNIGAGKLQEVPCYRCHNYKSTSSWTEFSYNSGGCEFFTSGGIDLYKKLVGIK